MTLDTFSRTLGRRGLLAALGALVIPASTRALPACAAEGEACSLTVGCCGDTVCKRSATNPNVGVCVEDDDDDGRVTCRQLTSRLKRNRRRLINCNDFTCQGQAQRFLRRYPHDPCNLDGDGDGRACETLRRCRRRRRR
jgi:hypothetical protein